MIAAAGKGTRFLPASKEIQKEMLPVLEKPCIQYVVEEIVAAGITNIIVVVDKHKPNQIKAHFGPNPSLEKRLLEAGKQELLTDMEHLSEIANFNYVEQWGPYGNGTPLLCARGLLEPDQPCMYAFADDLILSPKSFITSLLQKYQRTPGIIVGGQEVPREEVVNYGIFNLIDEQTKQFDRIVEKPSPEQAPSRLAVFGRYIIEPALFEILAQKRLGKDNELWIADAISEYIERGGKGYVQPVTDGKWLTTGDPFRTLICCIEYARSRPDLRAKIETYLKQII